MKAKIENTYTIKKERNDKETIITGTLSYLINYFSYTLEVGNSWNPKINRNPTTIYSFITNLQKSFEAQEACCYNRTSITLL
jgi:hypothetical protein